MNRVNSKVTNVETKKVSLFVKICAKNFVLLFANEILHLREVSLQSIIWVMSGFHLLFLKNKDAFPFLLHLFYFINTIHLKNVKSFITV